MARTRVVRLSHQGYSPNCPEVGTRTPQVAVSTGPQTFKRERLGPFLAEARGRASQVEGGPVSAK